MEISKIQVLPVYHALQGHPESGKMWIKLINNIIINELGFHTTTHDRVAGILHTQKSMVGRISCLEDGSQNEKRGSKTILHPHWFEKFCQAVDNCNSA